MGWLLCMLGRVYFRSIVFVSAVVYRVSLPDYFFFELFWSVAI